MFCKRLRIAHRHALACATGLCLVLSGHSWGATASAAGNEALAGFSVVPNESFVVEIVQGEPAEYRKEYRLSNQGPERVTWTAAVEGNWLQIDGPAQGSLEPGAEGTVRVVLNTRQITKLAPATYNGTIRFSSEPAKTQTHVQGKLVVAAPTDLGSAGSLVKDTDEGEDPVLIPGVGFFGPTEVPTTVSTTAAGANAKAIALWNVVPYQDAKTTFRVGVVAFHINGIDRVEFSLENGPWIPVTQMTYNRRSDTVEYKIALDPRTMGYQGLVELRAVAYPTIGIPRVLDPLFLNADPNNSLVHAKRWVATNGSDSSGNGSQNSPFRTIARAAASLSSANEADGGIIYLQAGSHSLTSPGSPVNTSERWLTIQPAPGLTKSDVVLNNSEWPGLQTRLIRLRHLTIRTSIPGGDAPEGHLWVDGCDLIGQGQFTISFSGSGEWENGFEYRAITDSIVSDNAHGFLHSELMRNVHQRRIGSDTFHHPKLVVNCSVDNIYRGPNSAWHPDVFAFAQGNANNDNHIVYGLRATNCIAQGIFAKQQNSISNVAFVNVLIEGDTLKSQWGSTVASDPILTDHLLMWNVTIAGQGFSWRGATLSNVSIRGCAFKKMGILETTNLEDHFFESNHFEEAGSIAMGVDVTTGPSGWVDASNDVYRPSESSILRDRLMQPSVKIDVDGNRRPAPASLGAYE
jgi:hypothetical protein